MLEGENQIEITAFLDDGRTASERFRVDYVRGLPSHELEEQLKRLRFETAALTERVRGNLVTEMEANRRSLRQRRQLELSVRDDSPLPFPEP